MTTLPNGQYIPLPPPLHIPPHANITGSPIDAASTATINAQNTQAATAKALGVGQKGSSRRKRLRGGLTLTQNLNVVPPNIPTANTYPGVTTIGNHIKAVDTLNQIRASGMFDTTSKMPPIQVAGTKRKRKTNGRRRYRTHRRRNSKSTHRRRRSRRSVV
jgi:hypothetical protein